MQIHMTYSYIFLHEKTNKMTKLKTSDDIAVLSVRFAEKCKKYRLKNANLAVIQLHR